MIGAVVPLRPEPVVAHSDYLRHTAFTECGDIFFLPLILLLVDLRRPVQYLGGVHPVPECTGIHCSDKVKQPVGVKPSRLSAGHGKADAVEAVLCRDRRLLLRCFGGCALRRIGRGVIRFIRVVSAGRGIGLRDGRSGGLRLTRGGLFGCASVRYGYRRAVLCVQYCCTCFACLSGSGYSDRKFI